MKTSSRDKNEKGQYLCWVESNEQDGYTAAVNPHNPWPSLEHTLKSHGTTMPILFSNPRLNCELPFLLVCRELHIPATTGNGYDIPWTLHTLRLFSHDTLIGPYSMLDILHKSFKKRYKEDPPCRNIICIAEPERSMGSSMPPSFILTARIDPPAVTPL